MSLPEDRLSSYTELTNAPFIGGKALVDEIDLLTDIEEGGVAIQDPSLGLQYQFWRARVRGNGSYITLEPENGSEFTVITSYRISQVSLTFDQNMQVCIAYVDYQGPKLYWYDPTPGNEQLTTLLLPEDVISPRVSLDIKAPGYANISDIILAYLKNGNLYHRRQRDRYENEILLAENVYDPESLRPTYLNRIGMNEKNRFQFELIEYWSQEESIADMLEQAPDPYTEIDPPYQVSGTTATTFDSGSSTIYRPDNEESQE